MATENFLSGQKRIQVELARLGVTVSARTIAKYMRGIHRGKPSRGWRNFLGSHAREIWACDFFCVRTIFFRTIYVFFIIHYASREVVHVRTTRHPTSEWTGQQIIEACDWHVSHRAFSCMTATDLPPPGPQPGDHIDPHSVQIAPGQRHRGAVAEIGPK
jgi:hypothetical protein